MDINIRTYPLAFMSLDNLHKRKLQAHQELVALHSRHQREALSHYQRDRTKALAVILDRLNAELDQREPGRIWLN